MQKWFTILAVCFSSVALGLSVHTFQTADARAEEALQKREKALVAKLRPGVQRVYNDFKLKFPSDPETLDELLAPLFELLKGLSK